MSFEQIVTWIGALYLALSAVVTLLATLGAVMPGAAGEWCAKAAVVVGKAVAAVGELRGAAKPAAKQVGP